MARYTGSKTKLSRHLGRNLFLKGARSFSAKDDFTKRPYRPGTQGKRRFRRVSEYGRQLEEKQAIRFTYGLVEKQLTNLFKKAFKTDGDTGKIALAMLERRLDNVVYKAGLANSRAQARQLVSHAQFNVNGVKVNIPSYQVKAGDIITVRDNKVKRTFWTNFQLEVPAGVPAWIDSSKKFTIKIINLPTEEDLPKDFKMAAVVEWYSRRVG